MDIHAPLLTPPLTVVPVKEENALTPEMASEVVIKKEVFMFAFKNRCT